MKDQEDQNSSTYLVSLSGKDKGKRVDIEKPLYKNWDKHFRIEYKNGFVILNNVKHADVNVNGKSVTEAVLKNGDHIHFPDGELHFNQDFRSFTPQSSQEDIKENKNMLRQFLVALIVIAGGGVALLNNPEMVRNITAKFSGEKKGAAKADATVAKTTIQKKLSKEALYKANKITDNDRLALARSYYNTALRLSAESGLHPTNLTRSEATIDLAINTIKGIKPEPQMLKELKAGKTAIRKQIDLQLEHLKHSAQLAVVSGNNKNLKQILELIMDTEPHKDNKTHQWAKRIFLLKFKRK